MKPGTEAVLYSCQVSLIDKPFDTLAIHQTWEDQKVAEVRTFTCCKVHQSFGSNIMPRYLWDVTVLTMHTEVNPSELLFSNTKSVGVASLKDLGKFISPSLLNPRGELWVCDQSNPPSGLSIISFNLA